MSETKGEGSLEETSFGSNRLALELSKRRDM